MKGALSERTQATLGRARRLALILSLVALCFVVPSALAKPLRGISDPDGIQISWDAKTETVTVNWKAQSGSGVSKVTVYVVIYRNDIAQSWRQYDYTYNAPYLKSQSGVSTWGDAPAISGDTIWVRLLVYSPKSGSPVSDTTDTLIVP